MAALSQYLFSGLTIGAVYAVVAIGFTLIYTASDIVNFAQGEFVMIGGMTTAFLLALGMPLPAAAGMAIVLAVIIGLLLHRLAIEPARDANAVTLIIITMGASIFLRGLAQLVFDKQFHTLPSFTGEKALKIFGAAVLPQSLWVLGSSIVMFVGLWIFLDHVKTGKALRATAANRLAAQLVGINTSFVLALAFGVSAALGAIAGILVTPITLTRYDVGVMLALKGFAAAVLGGIGSPVGAVVGGLLLGLIEALAAGYITSVYKDGVAFVALILVLLMMPQGLLGSRVMERV
jgi:branched-chain amino acid transport system permease protein